MYKIKNSITMCFSKVSASANVNVISSLIVISALGIYALGISALPANAQSDAQGQDSASSPGASVSAAEEIDDPYGLYPRYDPASSFQKRNPAPKGYFSLPSDEVSGFGNWLRKYPMRSEKELLTTSTGGFVADATVIGGVMDVPTSSTGWDARGILYPLMHEFARVSQRELEVEYRGLADDSVSMLRYLTGKYSTNSTRTKYFWKEGAERALDDALVKRFTEFARTVTSYNSLVRDCQEINADEVMPGDLFIQNTSGAKSEGHLSVVIDVATLDSKAKKSEIAPALKDDHGNPYARLIVFANSLTPATCFHIIKPVKPGKANWIIPGELQNKLKHIGSGKFYRLKYRFLR